MAKTLKEENLRLNIIVNGDPARKEILQLTRNSRDLRAENERLRAEQKKLRTEGGANKARIEEISRCASEVQDALISILSEKRISIPELSQEVAA